jgi:cytochrome c oxidase accessory protein FixG
LVALQIDHKRMRTRLKRSAPAGLQGRVVPQSVKGRYRRLKWSVLASCLAIYYVTPFLRWNRGPGQPDQAVLIDIERIRFHFFSLELMPHDLILLTGGLVLATLILILLNALAGRIWCGYACPQTVWSDLFMLVERLIDGDRRARLRDREQPLSVRKAARAALKHTVWLLIGLLTGGAFVLYFTDAPGFLVAFATGGASLTAYAAVATLTATTYVLAGLAREQVCTWMCPWPRLQGAIWDPEALTVNYRDYRGEERASAKKATEARAAGKAVGDCVDCNMCVTVCPMGIDIREGPNFACINCGLCVDACDNVMDKLSRPRGLIDYESWNNIDLGRTGAAGRVRLLRPKTAALAGAILVLAMVMVGYLVTKADHSLSVVRDQNPVAVMLSDGSVRNAYSVRIYNNTQEPRSYALRVLGLDNAEIRMVSGVGPDGGGTIGVDASANRVVRVLVSGFADAVVPLEFIVVDAASGAEARTNDLFAVRGR